MKRAHSIVAQVFLCTASCLVFAFPLLLVTSVCADVGETGQKKELQTQEVSTAPEFRGLWITRFEWPSEDPEECREKIVTIMKDLEEAHFNAAVFQIRGAAEVLYRSTLEPWSPLIGGKDPGFDPLELAIEEAHKRGIQFHAYINPIPLMTSRRETPPHTTPEHLFHLHGPESPEPWVCVDEEGNLMNARAAGYYYLSPGIPDVHAYLRKVIMDVVKRYDVDGIHLDRIRYPGRQYSHDPVSTRRFYGRGNPNRREWADWQREQLSKFINDLQAEIMAEKPQVVLSCAAWGIYNRYHLKGYYNFSSGYHDYYQDTWNWIRIGAMDVLMPMIYWNIPDPKPNYDELMKDFKEGIGADRVIGGQRAYGERWGFEENVDEILATRQLGALGTVLFAYGSVKEKGGFELLKDKLYQQKVAVPELSWKTNPEHGVILGTVTDENGKPLTDAWISLTPDAGDRELRRQPVFRHSWTSSADGRFAFLKVPPVPVKLTVEYDGAEKTELAGIQVAPGEVKQLTVAVPGAQQAREQLFFHVFSPEDGEETTREVVHILGRTMPEYKMKVEETFVPVYATGAFALDNIPLERGENQLTLSVMDAEAKTTTTRFLTVLRKEREPRPPIRELQITEPSQNLSLLPGDVLEIKMRGPAGMKGYASCWKGRVRLPLKETENAEGQPTGEYSALYKVPAGFSAAAAPVQAIFKEEGGFAWWKKKHKAESKVLVEVWDASKLRIGETKEEKVGITFGTHYVRLGGPYLEEIPKGTRFEITGRQGNRYQIRLSKSLSGWVSAEAVELLPEGTSPPQAFFTYCTINGDEKHDTLWIPLREPVVYAITPETDPQNCLLLDFFNTHYATTWISHKSGAHIIGSVTGEQLEDDWYRLRVPLNSKQIWGYWVERGEGGITIYIKRPPQIAPPPDSPVKGLTFAVEAGHGGRGSGAIGLMGTNEKTVNLNAVHQLRKLLEERGAKTVMMRPGDSNPRFTERMQYADDADADLIISIHANAAGTARGFNRVSGTSTYYKHKHCYPLAKLIYHELLKLEWGEFGVVGNFNYYPLRDTRIPGMLVEQAFMTHPYDEARLLDPEYQEQQAEAILKGIEAFLSSVRE